LQTVKDNVSALKRPSGELTTTDRQVADVLGNFFQSVFTKEDEVQDQSKLLMMMTVRRRRKTISYLHTIKIFKPEIHRKHNNTNFHWKLNES